MSKNTSVMQMWSLGLTEKEAALVREVAGPEAGLSERDASCVHELVASDSQPLLVWIARSVWEHLSAEDRDLLACAERPVLILVAAEDADADAALDQGFLAVARRPLDPAGIREAMFQVGFMHQAMGEMRHMASEIMLSREIMARKADHLEFLVGLLEARVQDMSAGRILDVARRHMNRVLPVRALQGVFWNPRDAADLESILYLSPQLDPDGRDAWMAHILDQAMPYAGRSLTPSMIHILPREEAGAIAVMPAPHDMRSVFFPLRMGEETFGGLALACDNDVKPVRDQVQVLRAAVNHLDLALYRAAHISGDEPESGLLLMNEIRNRRSFDARLNEEFTRHQRYRNEFSILLLDFSRAQELVGRHAADQARILAGELGQIVVRNMRSRDYAALYGESEFVVILPQTGEKQAWMFANRLRRDLAEYEFCPSGQSLRLCADIQVATIKPGLFPQNADPQQRLGNALYVARSAERHAVCTL
jgi:diguanylate cyclase (GGDEF)-like protein